MRFDAESYLQAIKAARKRKRSALALLCVLSILVSGNVFWLLRGTGIALEADEDPTVGSETEYIEETTEETEPSETTVISEYPEETDPSGDIIPTETSDTEEKTYVDENTEESDIPEVTSSSDELIPEPSETEIEETDKNVYQKSFYATTQYGIEVIVDSDYDAFPEGTTMTVTYYGKKIVASKLEEEEIIEDDKEITDLIALDISFFDKDGNEIEPVEGSLVSVSIMIPDEICLEGDEFRLIHLDSEGNASKMEEAVVSERGADFFAEEFSIYVVTGLGEKDINEVHEWVEDIYATNVNGYIPNSDYDPYVLGPGDEITVVYFNDYPDRYLYPDNAYQDYVEVVGINEPQYIPELGKYRHESRITALKPGKVRLILEGEPDAFYVEVRDLCSNDHVIDFADYNFSFYGDPNNPYDIKVGDNISMICDSSDDGAYFFLVDRYGNRLNSSNFLNIPESEMHKDPNGAITAVLDATAPNYSPYNEYMYNDQTIVGVSLMVYGGRRTVYFRISEKALFDHADIEIDEGGEYIKTKVYTENGVLKKEVDTYSSCVSYVYDCSMYDEDGNYCTFYKDSGSSNDILEGVHGYSGDYQNGGDYWKNPNKKPGETQYELTSKYAKDEYGNTIHNSNKKYSYEDVDHVVFDIQLELEPKTKNVYVKNGDQWVLESSTDTSGNPVEYFDHAVFTMDRRDVIDAYNKCPFHNGLDFTVKTNKATVQIEAKKTFVNGTLEGDDFEFELYQKVLNTATGEYEDQIVATAQNDINGKILFNEMSFDTPGTYEYFIREKAGTDSTIIYDTSVYTVTVTIGPDMSVDVTSSSYNYEFTNSALYTLPDTGGIGITPFVISGIALISSAIYLSVRKRKRAGP